jgi:hypothetical protein
MEAPQNTMHGIQKAQKQGKTLGQEDHVSLAATLLDC